MASQAATSGRVGTGMETCEVQNAVTLGPLFLVYPTQIVPLAVCMYPEVTV